MKRIMLILSMFFVVLLTACGSNGSSETSNPTPEKKVLAIGTPIPIPQGYRLIEATAFGKFFKYETLFCEQISTGKVFTCTNGTIGKEIVVPNGYTLVGVSSYGEYFGYDTFYCQKNGTTEVYICNPQ